MTTLLIAEHDNASLKDATNKALTAATALGGDVHVLVAGKDAKAGGRRRGQARRRREGAARRRRRSTRTMLAEPLAALIVSLAPAYDAIVAPATSRGKNVMPRVAALLDVMQISEIIKVDRARHLRAADLCRQRDPDREVDGRQEGHHRAHLDLRRRPARAVSAPVETVAAGGRSRPVELRRRGSRQERSSRTDLGQDHRLRRPRACRAARTSAKYIEPLADKLGAGVGASRAAVDAGYAPNDWQVGQTGKVVAPELYIAVGISGAIQHLAGMKDSKVIVAINKDEEAPIFQVADYGLVADLYQAVPELTEELGKLGR